MWAIIRSDYPCTNCESTWVMHIWQVHTLFVSQSPFLTHWCCLECLTILLGLFVLTGTITVCNSQNKLMARRWDLVERGWDLGERGWSVEFLGLAKFHMYFRINLSITVFYITLVISSPGSHSKLNHPLFLLLQSFSDGWLHIKKKCF